MSDSSSFSQHTRRLFSGTLLSRISGFVRDLSMAFAFGDHPALAAFMVAYRLANACRRLVGEGPLQSAFIPYFEGMRVKDPEHASSFFRTFHLSLIILLLVLVAAIEATLLLLLFFGAFSPAAQEILVLTAWMVPGLLFISLYGVNISVLQCFGSFFLPSFAPFVTNLLWIAAVLSFRNQSPERSVLFLTQAVVIGFFLQWAITFPGTFRAIAGKLSDWWCLTKKMILPEMKELAHSFTFGALGIGAAQVNGLLDSLFARYADLKGPVYLWYSIRLEQLALALFGIATASVVIPVISRAIKSGEKERAEQIFSSQATRLTALMIVITVALFALGGSSVDFLYGRGHFSAHAFAQTTYCLWAYGISLIPSSLIILVSALFYAQNDFRTPTKISLLAIAMNIALNALFVFVFHMGAVSTAVATGISSWMNGSLLFFALRKRGWKWSIPWITCAKLFAAGLFALLMVLVADSLFCKSSQILLLLQRPQPYPQSFVWQSSVLAVHLIAFFGGAGLFSLLVKEPILFDLIRQFLPKRLRKSSAS